MLWRRLARRAWLLLLLSSIAAEAPAERDWMSWDQLDAVRNILFRVAGSSGSPEAVRRSMRGPGRHKEAFLPTTPKEKFQVPVDPGREFPCTREGARSPSRPDSVHKLRPGDIDVVAAMGDSLTSGNGVAAANLLHIAIENKGMSWSIGGQSSWREFLTLPNILKELNADLVGYSAGDTWSHKRAARFNVAEGFGTSQDMPFQAKLLVRRIASDPRVDIHSDWKIVTLMIGSNDFCTNMCYYKNLSNMAEDHRADLTATLDYLKDNLPRTLVSVVPPPDLVLLTNLTGRPFSCHIMNRLECTCLFSDKFQHLLPRFQQAMQQFQHTEHDLVYSGRYDDKEDFAVVLQPFTMRIQFPVRKDTGTSDLSYMSTDCFHISQKGHARAANALWNNLLEPVGAKTDNWLEMFERFLCPSEERPYIYTRANSPA